MTIQELIIALDDARDDAVVFTGTDIDNCFDIKAVIPDENGNIVLLIEDDGIVTNLSGGDIEE